MTNKMSDLEYEQVMDEAEGLCDAILELLEERGPSAIAAAIACRELSSYLEDEFGFSLIEGEEKEITTLH